MALSFVCLFTSLIYSSPALAAPATPDAALPGQIVVNPADRRWFSYNRDADGDGKLDPFYWAGPGGPEDFLYRGTRQADGTRSGDQMDIVNRIGSAGANAIYFQIVRSHGGDGDATHNPFNNNDPNQPLNRAIVTQWNTWLSELETRGIVVYLAVYDDGADPYRTPTMSAAEKAFVDEIVDQLERHTNIVWSIAEEYSESFGNYLGRLSQIAAEIRAADDYDHPISIHHLQGDTTMDVRSDPNVNQFAMQSDGTSPAEVYADVLAGYQDAAGRWNVNMSENWNNGNHDHAWDLKNNDRADARMRNWAAGMAGGYALVVGAWESVGAAPPAAWLADWGNQAKFFMGTNFQEMQPDAANRRGGTQYLLSKPGDSYIAYASYLAGNIGIAGVTAGAYRVLWLDIPTNAIVVESKQLDAGEVTLTRPAGIGTELAVYLKKQTGGTPPPGTLPKRVYIPYVQ